MTPLWVLVLHVHTRVLTHSLNCTFISENALFCQHVSLWCQLIPPLALHLQQNPLHCLNVNNNKRSTEHATHCLQSAAAGGKGSRRCVYTQTQHSQEHSETEMSDASDSISLVWARSLTDEATLCWWTCRFRRLNMNASVFWSSRKLCEWKKKKQMGIGGIENIKTRRNYW